MKLLVTGASGEIGPRLLDALAGRGVRALTRREAPPFELPGVSWVRGDVLDPGSLARATEGVDAVLHLAALTHSRDPAAYERVNADGTRNLLQASQAAGVERFVYLSSRALGEAGGGYSASKLHAEEHVRGARLAWVILRPAEVYGSGGRDPILSLAQSLERRPYAAVLGDGSYRLSPVLVDDVIPAIVRALDSDAAPGQTYTLAGPQEFSYLTLLERLEAARGLSRRLRIRVPLVCGKLMIACSSRLGFSGLVPDQIPRLVLAKASDNSAAERDLGYAPRSLEAGLAWLAERQD